MLTVFMLQPSFAWSQEDDPLEAIDALTYAKDHKLGPEVELALDPTNPNIIQCGKELCDLRKQYCYYVSEIDGFGRDRTVENYYKCYDEEMENIDNPGYVRHYGTCTHKTDCRKQDVEILFGLITIEGDYVDTEGSDGKIYRIQSGPNATIQYGRTNGEKGAFYGCEILPIKLFNMSKCMFCDLVGVVYDGTALFADISLGKIAKAFAVLLAVGFAIWIALQVLGHVTSLTKQDAPKFLGNLLRQSYKVLFAILLLYYPQNVFDYAINPLLSAGLKFGEKSLEINSLGEIKKIENKIATGGQGGAFFGEKTYKEIENYVISIQQELSKLQAVGGSMTCTGGRIIGMNINPFDDSEDDEATHIGDGFSILFQGAIMVVFGFLLSLSFTFYLLDAIVQMGIVGGLLPFMIASWPFKATANYTKTGVNMFMNSVFTLAFIGLIVSIDLQLINEGMSASSKKGIYITVSSINGSGFDPKLEGIEIKDTETNLLNIAKAFHSQDVSKLLELTDITGTGLLILVLCCYFGFKFLGEASSLANQFASGALTGKGALAPKIATMGASTAKNLALGATKDIRKAAGDKIGAGMKAVANSPFSLGKAGINKLRNRKSKDKE